jgi:hypothetical protein
MLHHEKFSVKISRENINFFSKLAPSRIHDSNKTCNIHSLMLHHTRCKIANWSSSI